MDVIGISCYSSKDLVNWHHEGEHMGTHSLLTVMHALNGLERILCAIPALWNMFLKRRVVKHDETMKGHCSLPESFVVVTTRPAGAQAGLHAAESGKHGAPTHRVVMHRITNEWLVF